MAGARLRIDPGATPISYDKHDHQRQNQDKEERRNPEDEIEKPVHIGREG
jgi:hypothetical protein